MLMLTPFNPNDHDDPPFPGDQEEQAPKKGQIQRENGGVIRRFDPGLHDFDPELHELCTPSRREYQRAE